MATFRLQIVTMDGPIYDGEVQRIKLRTIHGDLAILARHMNYVTAIGMGTATVTMEDGTERKAACIGGMLTMMNNLCRVIPTTWEWGEDIDVARAMDAKRRAEEKLAQSISDRTVGRFNVGYILVFPFDDHVGSIKVTKSILEAWGVSEEQLFADALANDRKKEALFTSLSEMMAGFMGGPVQNLFKMEQEEAVREAKQATGSGIPLFILTIRDGFYASSLMADEDLLRKISEILQEDYFILPSSIHEVLIAPRSVSNAEYLKETVKAVNTEQVAEVEQLSDNIHLYCYKEHILTAA